MAVYARMDYFLVLDFEATCKNDGLIQPQEIIEFPVVCVDGRTGEILWVRASKMLQPGDSSNP